MDKGGHGARSWEPLLLLCSRTVQWDSAHWVGEQSLGAADWWQGEGTKWMCFHLKCLSPNLLSVLKCLPFRLQAVTLPLSLTDGKWHHVCVTWTTRDGQWEAYQDGVQRGSGINLSPWHPVKPGGVFILGQEQVNGSLSRCTQPYIGSSLSISASSSGHSRGTFWRHSVICGGDVRPAHVVPRFKRQWHLQLGLLRQPSPGWCHCLGRGRGGAPWRGDKTPFWPLPLKGSHSTCWRNEWCTVTVFNTEGGPS